MTLATVAWWATALAVASFVIFTVQSIVGLLARASIAEATNKAAQAAGAATESRAEASAAPSVPELTDLLKALTSAIEAVVKAGPGLAGLLASVLFIGIAAWALGSVSSKPKCSVAADTPALITDGKLGKALPVVCE